MNENNAPIKDLPDSYHEVSKFLQRFHKLLPESGLVAGGAARDIYHGVEPKDYDVVYTNKIKPNMLVSALSDYVTIYGGLVDILDTFNFGTRRVHFTEEKDAQVSVCSSDDRILYGIKIKLNDSTAEIDLLIYNVESIFDIATMFDYNINQFAMLNGEPCFVGGYGNDPLEVGLKPARGLGESPRDVKRLEKLKGIAKAFGYVV